MISDKLTVRLKNGDYIIQRGTGYTEETVRKEITRWYTEGKQTLVFKDSTGKLTFVKLEDIYIVEFEPGAEIEDGL